MYTTSKGVTLSELLVCIAILAIIFCYGLSVTPWLYKKNQIERVGVDIKNAIHVAEAQAQHLGDILILRPLSSDQDWTKGMGLFSAGRTLIYEWHWPVSGLHVTWHGFQSNEYLRFTPFMRESAVNGSFMISDAQYHGLQLVVNRMGRVKEMSIREFHQ